MNFGKERSIDKLFDALPRLKHLRELSFTNSAMSGPEYVKLFQKIKEGGKLEVLDLS